jgi:predicted enzyme related to lactoylglutathione lyase
MGNRIVHLEFVAEDMAKAQEFYGKVFGWETRPIDEEYTLWQPGEGELGGGFTKSSSTGQRTFAYIHVEDMEGKLKEIEAAGGKVTHPKTEIGGDHGFYAMFTDPNGTLVCLWSKT